VPDTRRLPALDSILRDLRYTFRTLRRETIFKQPPCSAERLLVRSMVRMAVIVSRPFYGDRTAMGVRHLASTLYFPTTRIENESGTI
jgi:hypothetical protein